MAGERVDWMAALKAVPSAGLKVGRKVVLKAAHSAVLRAGMWETEWAAWRVDGWAVVRVVKRVDCWVEGMDV